MTPFYALCDRLVADPSNHKEVLDSGSSQFESGSLPIYWISMVSRLFKDHGDIAKVALKLASAPDISFLGFGRFALVSRLDVDDLLNAYQELSRRTKDGNTVIEGPLHAYCNWSMGIVGEVGEVVDLLSGGDRYDELVEEYGDILWYFAAMCTDLGIPLSRIYSKEHFTFSLNTTLEQMTFQACNEWKKLFCHGHEIDVEHEATRLHSLQVMLQCAIQDGYPGFDLEELLVKAMATNIAKLDKRYKEKFTTEESVNRCN